MQGLIPERSYSSWVPETCGDSEYRRQIEGLEVEVVFRNIDWKGKSGGVGDDGIGKSGEVTGQGVVEGYESEKLVSSVSETSVRACAVETVGTKRKATKKSGEKMKRKVRKSSEGSRAWR